MNSSELASELTNVIEVRHSHHNFQPCPNLRLELDERSVTLLEDIKGAKERASSNADLRECVRVLEREWTALRSDSDTWQSSIDDALTRMKAFEKDMHEFSTR